MAMMLCGMRDPNGFQHPCGKDDGGGSAPAPAPAQQTVTQTSIPEYARPYVENLMGRAQAATTGDVYQQYPGERIAGFSPLQQQAFQGIASMAPAAQIGQASGIAGLAGLGGLGAGGAYAQMATDPSQIQAYMSPYMQNVVDVQQREAQRQAGIAGTQRQARATGAGAFGGSRQAIVEAEAQRNLARQLGDIQAQGLQNAFQNAQQAQQFGANLGLQGLGLAGQQAATLGQLGQTQYGQQMGISAAQQQAGAQQQALEQQRLSQQYQDFLNQVRFPYQQMAFMSDILRGMPLTGQSAQSIYQAPPSSISQNIGLLGGLGSLGAAMFRGT